MPKREDEYWAGDKEGLRYCVKHKRYYRADIGCQLCSYEALEHRGGEGGGTKLKECPRCGEPSLFWNEKTEFFECLNVKCKRKYTFNELSKAGKPFPSRRHGPTRRDTAAKTRRSLLRDVPYWFRAIRRTLRPVRRQLPKLVVLPLVLAVAVIVVVVVCQFVANNLKVSTLVIFLILGLPILIWGLNSVSKYRLKLARAFMVLLISTLFIIVSAAYLDLRAFEDVEGSIMDAFSTERGQFRSSIDLLVHRTELRVVDISSVVAAETAKGVTKEEEATGGEEATVVVDTTHYVHIDGGILVGADGHYITLKNNPDATNPSWEELKAFLLKDKTDSKRYDNETFVCGDFAEMLHNNAEEAGIKAAFVCLWLGPCSYYPVGGGHALNAFETTDRSLLYVDCTGSNLGVNADKIVDVEVGKDYIPKSIFSEPGWDDTWSNVGTVEEIQVLQW